MRLHHDIHHQAYVNGLNKAELELEKARQNKNFDMISYWENQLAFNGSGHILHSVFWTIMTPPGAGGQPGMYTMEQINKSFGSFDGFLDQFKAAAAKVEGSGWAILVWNPAWGRLEVLTAEKHQNLTEWGSIPILPIDVWEHAYYLDYQNKRPDYINNFVNIINWNAVEERLLLAMKGETPITLENKS